MRSPSYPWSPSCEPRVRDVPDCTRGGHCHGVGGTRSEALVEMLRRGLDADPAYTGVAGATDSREIRVWLGP